MPDNKHLTYAGSLDDVCQRFPGKVAFDDAFYRRVLLRSVFFGHGLLLNDGYLVANTYLRQALTEGPTSLAFSLIESGFIRLLSIYDDVRASISQRAKTGVLSHSNLISSVNWSDLQTNIKILSDAQTRRTARVPWPSYDMTDCFLKLMRRTLDRPAAALGLTAQDSTQFFRFINLLTERLQLKWAAARTQWETICLEAHESGEISQDTLTAFMGIANEAYHIGFAACLASDSNTGISVETIKTGAFDEVLGASDRYASEFDLFEPLPAQIDDLTFTDLAPVFNSTGSSLRQAYLTTGQEREHFAYLKFLETEYGPLQHSNQVVPIAVIAEGHANDWVVSRTSSLAVGLTARTNWPLPPTAPKVQLDALRPDGLAVVSLTKTTAGQIVSGVRKFEA